MIGGLFLHCCLHLIGHIFCEPESVPLGLVVADYFSQATTYGALSSGVVLSPSQSLNARLSSFAVELSRDLPLLLLPRLDWWNIPSAFPTW